MAVIARPGGETEFLPNREVTLEKAQQVIGGYVERVCPSKYPDFVILCDEEGLLKELPLNELGTELYQMEESGPIVGTIIIFNRQGAREAGWL